MNIQQKYPPTSYNCDLLKLDEELASPKVTSLVNQGYTIKAVIPVEDQGKPVAIIIMQHEPTLHHDKYTHIISALVGATSVLFLTFVLHFFTS